MNAIECLGQWFHTRLHSEKQRLGVKTPDHDEDAGHDAAVGATLLLALTGRVDEAVALYNEWASVSGYVPIKMLSREPLTVDIGDGVLRFEEFTFYLLQDGTG